ncbi:MAG TPA: hypothetical protein VG074_12485 [Acidimicrobiales bacterium]|nr:hypothetical protein [Acidimicrobiales bacterium]
MTAVRTDFDSLLRGGRWDRSAGSERTPVVPRLSAQVIGSATGATTADGESIFGARPTS